MKNRIFTKIAVIYSLVTLLYYVVVRIISECLEMDHFSRIELGSTAGIICFAVFLLSISFKIVSLFFIKKRLGFLVALSIFWSATNHITLGSNVIGVLLCLALVAAVAVLLVGLIRGKIIRNALVNILIAFIIVVPFCLVAFVLSTYEIYESNDCYMSPDNAYIVEKNVTYDIHNEPIEQFIYLRKNKYFNIGMLYLCDHYNYINGTIRYLDGDNSTAEIKWIDNDTIEIDGETYEVSTYIK